LSPRRYPFFCHCQFLRSPPFLRLYFTSVFPFHPRVFFGSVLYFRFFFFWAKGLMIFPFPPLGRCLNFFLTIYPVWVSFFFYMKNAASAFWLFPFLSPPEVILFLSPPFSQDILDVIFFFEFFLEAVPHRNPFFPGETCYRTPSPFFPLLQPSAQGFRSPLFLLFFPRLKPRLIRALISLRVFPAIISQPASTYPLHPPPCS